MQFQGLDERYKVGSHSCAPDAMRLPAKSPLCGDKYRNSGCRANFEKNASSADLNLTLQGYEFDHDPPRKLVKLSNNPLASLRGSPLPSRSGGTNFDTFEFLKPLEHPRHSGRS